mmetsp:Transcript_11367/g.47559  ORF Transcript_11367/g.47559 Transcript_11367/m.47559 type:complete len:325 (+) Transcript_11367:649-1623(+)
MAGGHAGHRAGKPGGERIQDSRPPRGRRRRDREREARVRQLCRRSVLVERRRTLRRRRHPRVARDQHRGRVRRAGVHRGRPRRAHAQERQTHGTGGLSRRRRFVVGARRRRVGDRLAGCVRRGDGTRRRRLERLEVSRRRRDVIVRRVGSRSSWRAGSRSSRHRAGDSPPVPPRTRERVGVLRAKGKAGAGGFTRRGCPRERTGAADPPANRFGRREADVLAPARRVRRRRASRARRQARAARAPSPDPRSVVRRLRRPNRGRERSGVVEVRHRRGDVTDPRGRGTSGTVVSRRRGRSSDARAARVRRDVRPKRHRAAPQAGEY